MNVNILTFQNLPIIEQLRIEEALLRTNSENWVLINTGSSKAIVMGISTKPHEVVNLPLATKDNIPLIQRFSGGGTVIVDENTLFVTFIFQKVCDLYPKSILEWIATHFKQALKLPHFTLQENDFALHDKKIGGNAQYIRKERFLHHTSFLWDFSPQNMSYLLHPPKEPTYRKGRPHLDFLTTLSPHLSKEEFESRLITHFSSQYQITINPSLPAFPEHRTSCCLITSVLQC